MIVKRYLSVDLDYWNTGAEPLPDPTRYLKRLFNTMTNGNLWVCYQHHHMLPHMNKYQPDEVVNVDWHTDIDNKQPPPGCVPEEGNWVHFVEGSHKHYKWIYPCAECASVKNRGYLGWGWCHDGKPNPFKVADPFPYCGWHKLTHHRGNPPHVDRFVAAGICLSPDWSDNEHMALLRRLCKDHGVIIHEDQ